MTARDLLAVVTARRLLFVVGAVWWSWFFYYGRVATAGFDFPWVRGYRNCLLDAMTAHVLPLYRAQHEGLPWTPWDNRVAEYLYWAHPQAPLLPQGLFALAPFPVYLLAPVLLFYALGCAGIARLADRYRLSFGPTALLFVLFMFNGHIVAHMGVWHFWEPAFLASWMIYFTSVAVEERPTTRDAILLGAVLTLIVYQGQMHVLVYDVLFLGLVALTVPRCAWWVARVGIVVAALGCARLLPIALIFPFAEPSNTNNFLAAYNTPRIALDAFVLDSGLNVYAAWWEYEAYIGWAALALVPFSVYGLLRWYRRLLPAILLTALWCYQLDVRVLHGAFDVRSMLRFDWWHFLQVPLFRTERAPTRLVLLPLLFAVLAGCRALNTQRWGNVFAIVVAAITVPLLHLHSGHYRSTFTPGTYERPPGANLNLDPAPRQVYVADAPNMSPPRAITYDTVLYRRAIGVGVGITLVSALGLLGYYRREAG